MVKVDSKTAIVLVNYNNHEDTADCLGSIEKAGFGGLVVVVDNASTRKGIEDAVGQHNNAVLITAPTNLGFGMGNNLGISWAMENTACRFIFLLNNDAFVESNTISLLEAALDDHPEAAVSCPRIVLADSPDVLWYGGGEVRWFTGSAVAPGYGGPADDSLAMTPRNVSFASGCAMLIRRSVFKDVGGFDPRFFMYIEDMELCLRIQEAGWTINYVPEALVRHKVQGSLRKGGESFLAITHPKNPRLSFYTYHFTRNRLLTMYDHARGRRALFFWAGWPLYTLAKCGQYARHKRWDAILAVFKACRDFIAVRGRRPENSWGTKRS